MRKLLTTMAVAAVVASSMSAQAGNTLRIGTEGAYAPWNYLDDDGKLAGYEIDLGNAICEKISYKCEFVQNEWDSIIPNLIAGNYDAIMAGMSVTDERKETINFTAEYFPPDPSRFAAAKDMEFDFANLKGKKIGVQGATIQADYVNETFGADNDVLSYENPDQSIADLIGGNVDILMADASFLEPVVNALGSISFVGEPVAIGGGVAAGLRQKDTELLKAIDDAIVVLKADGTVDKLIKQYFDKGPFFAQ
jgi:polar amino acid transport system substrate-binding protein